MGGQGSPEAGALRIPSGLHVRPAPPALMQPRRPLPGTRRGGARPGGSPGEAGRSAPGRVAAAGVSGKGGPRPECRGSLRAGGRMKGGRAPPELHPSCASLSCSFVFGDEWPTRQPSPPARPPARGCEQKSRVIPAQHLSPRAQGVDLSEVASVCKVFSARTHAPESRWQLQQGLPCPRDAMRRPTRSVHPQRPTRREPERKGLRSPNSLARSGFMCGRVILILWVMPRGRSHRSPVSKARPAF